MKAFHHSVTNLISVWKSAPRTVMLSENVKRCFICHSNSNFTSLLKHFFLILSFLNFFIYFGTYLLFTTSGRILLARLRLHFVELLPITFTKYLTAQEIFWRRPWERYNCDLCFVVSFYEITFFWQACNSWARYKINKSQN